MSDPFEKQIVDMVRQMPDEAILELVRAQLSDGGIVHRDIKPEKAEPVAEASPKRRRRAKSGKRYSAEDRRRDLLAIERFVHQSNGVSASEIREATGLNESRCSALVRDLKQTGIIHQGGDRRFARYAKTRKQAEAASRRAKG